ncbi:hydroxymethylbilane synthase [Sebaldella sp. S0638]|uniref:hydroxymethylbilane synthase n=1 Tax=Sebaldella sp. S0638 TaxID=2957809 RepID=UPI0020A20071|nr:hydroxymethylbilane synthase [Sebaldella sp. S0638]MCP1225059.1 hydroxymethylbilane synthase [Sebaldella sp. S0638]
MRKIIMGTRGSLLAVAQAETVKKMLAEKIPGLEIEIKKIVTSGDKDQTTNWGGDSSLKSMFVKEIEKELLEGTIDFAVHSMKDMPQISPKGLINACFPIREDNRDVLVSKNNTVFSEMPAGSVIGTSSLRRKSAVMELYPDMEIKPIRGNIHTRLGKLDSGEYDGIILAAAGLIRTGLENRISEYIDPEKMPPAPAQGILCVQCRENNDEILEILKEIDDRETRIVCEAEREFSRIFDGGCHTPMGCFAVIKGEEIFLKGMFCSDEKMYFGEAWGSTANPREAAEKLADIIRRQING